MAGIFIVRDLRPEDTASLVDVSVRAYASNFHWLEPTALEVAGYYDKVREMFERAIPAYDAGLVAEADRQLAGWGGRFRGKNTVADLWVDPDFQGQGAGTAILMRMFGDMREEGHKTAEIDTHERNEGARRLYERMGFRVYDHVMHWSNGLSKDIPTVLMRATLS